MWSIQRQLAAMPRHLYLAAPRQPRGLPVRAIVAGLPTHRRSDCSISARSQSRRIWRVLPPLRGIAAPATFWWISTRVRPRSWSTCASWAMHRVWSSDQSRPSARLDSGEPSTLPARVATVIARHLARLCLAGRGSAEGRHLGQLAGFTNQKPQRRLPTGLAPWVRVLQTLGALASQGPSLVGGAARQVVREGWSLAAAARGLPPRGRCAPSGRDTGRRRHHQRTAVPRDSRRRRESYPAGAPARSSPAAMPTQKIAAGTDIGRTGVRPCHARRDDNRCRNRYRTP